MRYFLYSHDGLGLGHTRRNFAVATALTNLAPEASVLMASGADDVTRMRLPPRVEVLKLPTMRKIANGQYAARRLQLPINQVCALRSALLLAAVEEFKPTAVLVDKHPFGIQQEFRAALATVRAAGGSAVLGFRDILDNPAVTIAEWESEQLQEQIMNWYDQVIIYGDRAVFDPVEAYQLSPKIAARTRFCGYVVNQDENDQCPELDWAALSMNLRTRKLVLGTIGGGEDGYGLLETFIRAAAKAPWQGMAIAGPMVPDREWKMLAQLAEEQQVTLQTSVPSLSSLLWSVDAVVCMGGYNTLVEAVSKGVPTVCVPRTQPRTEQLMRSEAFSRLGLVHTLRPEHLNPESLSQAVETVLAQSRQEQFERAHTLLNFDGANRAAKCLLGCPKPSTFTTPWVPPVPLQKPVVPWASRTVVL